MRTDASRFEAVRWLRWLAAACLVLVAVAPAMAQSVAGYSEYFVPADETNMWYVFDDLDNATTTPMHSVISVTAWSGGTTVYYDHWENGYNFDPNNPTTADETVVLATAGAQRTFESANIPTAPRGGATYYDGGDRIYVAGGTVTVTRASWIESVGAGNQSAAWEIYPVKPQLTTYVLPFGEDLTFTPFTRVYVLIQATANGTTFTVDLDGNGTADPINANRDATKTGDPTSVTLNAGQTFLLDRVSACTNNTTCTTNPGTLNTGTVIQGSSTLQVKFVTGNPGQRYCARGLSAFPRGFWTTDYYAPVDHTTIAGRGEIDYYLHNPHSTDITVSWASRSASGSFVIPPNSTVSFRAEEGDVPVDSGLHFQGTDVFWGVGIADSLASTYEWGFSLLPSTFLFKEHYLGWAPGYASWFGGDASNYDDVGVFLTVAQDNTRVFVDFDNDGTVDQTYTLDRLQTQYIFDPNDGDLSQAHIWATGDFTMAYGENGDTADTSNPSLDLGYVAIPGTDFMSLVLGVTKTASPQVVPTALGSTTKFTIDVDSQKYAVDDVSVVDLLPPNWAYTPGTTRITLPDLTTITGAAADPVNLPTYADFFSAASYANNDSTPTGTAWTTNWIEDGENNGTGNDNVRVLNDAGVTPNVNALRFRSSGATNGRALARMADLSSFPGGVLEFVYRRVGTDGAGDRLDVQVCANATSGTAPAGIACPGGWVPAPAVVGFNGTDAAYQAYSVDLKTLLPTSWDSPTFAVRFSTKDGSTLANSDSIWVDDVRILSKPKGTFAWLSSTLGGMAPNQRIRIEFWAKTTTALAPGTLSRNEVSATGTRTVGSPAVLQTFTATDFAYVASGNVQITKTSTATTPLYPGDTFTYTAAVSNLASSSVTLTGVSLYDALPAGVTAVAGTTTLNRSTVADVFTSQAYNLTAGTRSWGTNWTEANDTGGGATNGSPTQGDIQVTTLGELRLDNSNSNQMTIARGANLSGATSAILSFSYRTDTGVDAVDQFLVRAGINGVGGAMSTVGTITGITGASSGTFSVGIPVSANTAILFTFPAGSYTAATEFIYLDNVSITYDVSATGGGPPELASLYALAPGQSLTASFSVRVDDPLATGITSITNTASTTSAQFPIALTASVTNIASNPAVLSASVAGRVWLNGDGDLVQDIGEPGIGNVEVTLKDRFGTPVAVAYTDVNGRYLFTGVKAGTGYYVQATGLLAGLAQDFPAGHSDDRNEPFTLVDGQDYTGADLGYGPAANTLAFGDVVWVDSNASLQRELGEVGLAGVTVQLYLDDGNGGLDLADTLLRTATSAPDGSYLFTNVPNVPAGSSYFVAATAPANYTPTTGLSWRFASVVGGVAYLTGDFGFQASATTYTLTDRVWYDTNGNGLVAGEQGIAGVTVELLDGSLNVIGTAVTDGNGLFTFAGLTGNRAYTTRISDTSGFLQNYYGTTSFAIAKLRAEGILAGNVDRSAAPSYGFGASRSIGDTVFSDIDGNGSQGSGEPGIAGVVVALYRDANGNGHIDAAAVDCPPAASCLVGTVATDANGQYQFPGLTNGAAYIVSVGSPPSGYTYTGVGLNADSDPAAGGQQQSRIASGVTNVTNADFPYRPTSPHTISGAVWNDSDANGAVGAGESGLDGVTLDILFAGTVVATVTTGVNGAYTAANLPGLDGYTVRLTDTNGALNGYTATSERTEGPTAPFNYLENVNLSGGDVTNVNFGYRKPVPTYAAIAYLRAYADAGSITVEWRTSLEVGTAGFYLLRLDPATGDFVNLTERLLPGLIVHPQGGVYRFQDTGAPTEGLLTYKLIEQDVRGRLREYGPYRVSASGSAPPRADDRGLEDLRVRGFSRQAARPSRAGLATRSMAAAERRRAVLRRGNPRLGQAVKVTTRDVGLHYLSFADLAQRLGVPAQRAAGLIGTGRIVLSNRGRVVPYLPDGSNTGLYFHAEPVGSPFTDENAYWVRLGAGRTMSAASSASGGVLDTTFTETVHAEQDQYPLLTSFQDPQQDFWAWDWLFAGYEGMDVRSFTFQAAGVAGYGDTTLAVHLVGGSDGAPDSNHVQVLWNGVAVGEARWNGLAAFDVEFSLPPGGVLEGDNVVELRAVVDEGVPYNLFYVDSFDLTYQRLYRAVDDALLFGAANGSQVAIGGFSAPGVLLLDVTDPARPAVVTGASVALASDGRYEVRFGAAGASDTLRYLAVLPSRAKVPSELVAWRDPELRRDGNAADYLLVVPESLKDAAGPLAEYRSRRGISTMVVGLDDIYDEFNAGIAEPTAIRTFLRRATSHWSTPPRYVTLVGRGTWDYRNVQGFGDNLVPTLLAGSPDGLVASDVALADLEGDDGIPEIAIGRLPVLTSQEVLDYVAKIQAHESAASGEWQRRVLLAADNADAAGSFPTDSESVAALLPSGYTAGRVHLDTTAADAGRLAILQAVNDGVVAFNYIGHGGFDRLADENLFTSADVTSLNNAERMPVFLAMTCSVGNFAIPGYPSLGEAMLLRKGGGAFAVWAPSGLSENTHAVQLDQSFFRGAFVDNEKVVGDLVVRGLRDLNAPGSQYMRYMYNLLGEPVSRLPD